MGRPSLANVFIGYNTKRLYNDLLAGVVVGIVALPLAISFGIASGATPVIGIITTIISGFIIAVLSGSSVQIGGPTAACVVIVYGIIRLSGPSGLVLATFMAGAMLILMGVFKLGRVIRLIPDPLIEGFTAGIAVDLFTSQVRDICGLKMGALPLNFIDKCYSYIGYLPQTSIYALGLGLATIAINQIAPYVVSRKIPGPILSVTLTTIAAYFLHLPVTTIGTAFGPIVVALPPVSLPIFSAVLIKQLVRPAFAIAMLVSIMSLLSGGVAEQKIGKAFRSNKELVAEGIANLVSSVFGGIPVTGSIARTMTNIENGGRTPIAGIAQSITLLAILFAFGNLIFYIPVASIAGLLIVVAYNLGKWPTFWSILKSKSGDTVLLLLAFFTTIFIDLTVAIEAGLIFASFQFMCRMTNVSSVIELTNKFFALNGLYIEEHLVKYEIPKNVAVYEINGPLFFAVAYKFKESFTTIKVKPKIVIMRMRNVPIIDSTGIRTISRLAETLKDVGTQIVISEYKYDRVEEKLSRMLVSKIGKDNIHGTLKEAIDRCHDILEPITTSGQSITQQ